MEQIIEECDEYPEECSCPMCSGRGSSLGFLGNREWFRCRSCGMTFNQEDSHE